MKKVIVIVLGFLLVACGSQTSSKSISLEEAKKIALELKNGEIIEYDMDDDGFEIDIVLDGIKYDIEVSKDGKASIRDQETYNHSNNNNDTLNLEEAKQIALKLQAGEIVKAEQDEEGFDIDIVSGNIKYEVEVNWNREARIVDQEAYQTSNKAIDDTEANNIAIDRVGGGEVIYTSYDAEDNTYDVKVRYNNTVYEVEIDAATKQVIGYDIED